MKVKDDYKNSDWLKHQYYELGKSIQDIATEQGVSMIMIRKWIDMSEEDKQKMLKNQNVIKPKSYLVLGDHSILSQKKKSIWLRGPGCLGELILIIIVGIIGLLVAGNFFRFFV